jgi:predicted Fe-S protein YdhL (DUF1289 family)
MTATTRTPCIGICMINAEDERCYGCFRTLDEIASWGSYDANARMAIMDQLDERRARLDPGLNTDDE